MTYLPVEIIYTQIVSFISASNSLHFWRYSILDHVPLKRTLTDNSLNRVDGTPLLCCLCIEGKKHKQSVKLCFFFISCWQAPRVNYMEQLQSSKGKRRSFVPRWWQQGVVPSVKVQATQPAEGLAMDAQQNSAEYAQPALLQNHLSCSYLDIYMSATTQLNKLYMFVKFTTKQS